MTPFKRPLRLEQIYRREIERLIEHYFHFPTPTTLGEINNRLVEWQQANNSFQSFAMRTAYNMVNRVTVSNARSWRTAASQSSNGRLIYQMLRHELNTPTGLRVNALVKENANLIRSIPLDLAQQVTQHIKREQMKGVRSDAIVEQIASKMPELKRFQVKRIARTEVAKADTAITRARAEAINLNWYQWQTSEDARVRDSHRKMDLVLINWNDAPDPEQLVGIKGHGHYHAGNDYNCRCVALPVTTLSEISFPVKVYTGGAIRRLTLDQFKLLSGVPLRIAA